MVHVTSALRWSAKYKLYEKPTWKTKESITARTHNCFKTS